MNYPKASLGKLAFLAIVPVWVAACLAEPAGTSAVPARPAVAKPADPKAAIPEPVPIAGKGYQLILNDEFDGKPGEPADSRFWSSWAPGTRKSAFNVGVAEMTAIAGQKAVSTKSKKDISNFKLRKNMPVGVRVTLRGEQMYEFLDRLVAIAIPRVRDFRGINVKGFDGRGNYTMGITEQIIFPEVVIDKVLKINGLDITFVTTAKTDKECMALLKEFGLPFKK